MRISSDARESDPGNALVSSAGRGVLATTDFSPRAGVEDARLSATRDAGKFVSAGRRNQHSGRVRYPDKRSRTPMTPPLARPRSRLAVCLNSSFLGFYAHAGFMAALLELGVAPIALSGASAGALVAGLLAAGLDSRRVIDLLLHPDLRRTFFERGAPFRSLATMTNRPGHLGAIRGHHALALLKSHVGDRRIEECTAPRLALAVTNLTATRTEIVTAGPLAEFILASGAYPGMFAAREIGGRLFWDGGIANPVPFDHWIADPDIDTILVHSVDSHSPGSAEKARPLTIGAAAGLSHEIICDELRRMKAELARAAGKRLIFLQTKASRPSVLSAGKIGPRCVEQGRATVAEHRDLLAGLSLDSPGTLR